MDKQIQTLLVPLDLSDETERSILPAVRLALLTDASIVLFSWSFDEGEAAAAKRYFTDLAAELPVPTSVEAIATDDKTPGPSIVAAAARHTATICMAAHGRSGVGAALLGSTAEDVLRLGARPCLLVGPHVSADPTGDAPARVMACVDGSPLAERAVPVAAAWARELAAPLELVEVVDPLVVDDPKAAHGYLTDLEASLTRGVSSFHTVVSGEAIPQLVAHAGDAVELIVMSTHGRSGWSRTVLGSVAMNVVHRAHRPVLVVPARLGSRS